MCRKRVKCKTNAERESPRALFALASIPGANSMNRDRHNFAECTECATARAIYSRYSYISALI